MCCVRACFSLLWRERERESKVPKTHIYKETRQGEKGYHYHELLPSLLALPVQFSSLKSLWIQYPHLQKSRL
jgi:hypothetical protein